MVDHHRADAATGARHPRRGRRSRRDRRRDRASAQRRGSRVAASCPCRRPPRSDARVGTRRDDARPPRASTCPCARVVHRATRCCSATRGRAAGRSSASDSSTSPPSSASRRSCSTTGWISSSSHATPSPRGRLPRHGRRRRVPGARRVDRDRARAAVRVRQRRYPQPLRARSRAEPRRSARVDARVPRRRRADRRLRDRERAPVREQRVPRRLRTNRAGAGVPRRQARNDEDPAPGNARTAVRTVRPAVHEPERHRTSTAQS